MVTVSVVDPLNEPGSTAEPKWAVPDIDTGKFDEQVNKSLKHTGISR